MKVQKALERRAASYGENPKIRVPQMHKHTGFDSIKMDIRGISNGFCYIKQKDFVLEKESFGETMTSFHIWHMHV